MSRLYDTLNSDPLKKGVERKPHPDEPDLFSFFANKPEATPNQPLPTDEKIVEQIIPEKIAPVEMPVDEMPPATPPVAPHTETEGEIKARRELIRGVFSPQPHPLDLPRKKRSPNRIGLISVIVTVLAVCLVGAAFFFSQKPVTKDTDESLALSEESVADVNPAEASTPVVPRPVPAPPLKPVTIAKATPPTSAGPATPPAKKASTNTLGLKVPGMNVTEENKVVTLVFDDGLFSRTLRLSPAAQSQLKLLARQLEARTNQIAGIVAIGCTDNIPMTKNSEYKDNEELSQMRGQAVADFLHDSSKLRTLLIKAQGQGSTPYPFPNSTPADRARNRTAIIKVELK